jgi:hypothetical protein
MRLADRMRLALRRRRRRGRRAAAQAPTPTGASETEPTLTGAPETEPAPAPAPASALRGLGEPSVPQSREQAGEAELDTLRGELVRELDRMAEGDDGSGSFRRVAS